VESSRWHGTIYIDHDAQFRECERLFPTNWQLLLTDYRLSLVRVLKSIRLQVTFQYLADRDNSVFHRIWINNGKFQLKSAHSPIKKHCWNKTTFAALFIQGSLSPSLQSQNLIFVPSILFSCMRQFLVLIFFPRGRIFCFTFLLSNSHST
jgi:hypothetical protein